MHALIRKADNVMVAIVATTDGYDLALYNVVEVSGDPTSWAWDGTQLVPRAPTAAEETEAALFSDPRWVALKGASPAQIEAWLANNVTDLASARRVFKVLLLAIQALARTRT